MSWCILQIICKISLKTYSLAGLGRVKEDSITIYSVAPLHPQILYLNKILFDLISLSDLSKGEEEGREKGGNKHSYSSG